VDISPCRLHADGSVPVSSVLVSAETGSRTITHYRDLPEYGYADFASIDLQSFDWLHFEGRNPGELATMLEWARQHHPAIPVSLEIEKPRDGIEALFGRADVLLFSGDYARHRGYDEPAALLRDVSRLQPDADLYCTWGAAGAVSMDRAGAEYGRSALASGPVVDTLGAGDVFNAGVIEGYLGGQDMPGILRQACTLAGRKCTQTGFAGLTAAD